MKDLDEILEDLGWEGTLAIVVGAMYAVSFGLSKLGSSFPPSAAGPCHARGSAIGLAWLAGLLGVFGGGCSFFAIFGAKGEKRLWFVLLFLVGLAAVYVAIQHHYLARR